MAAMQQGMSINSPSPYNSTYRSYLMSNSIQIGGCMLGATMVPCLCCFGFVFTLGGISSIAADATSYFGPGPGTVIGSILLVVGLLLITGGVTLGCVSYNAYKNTRVANPGQPIIPGTGGAYLQGSSVPYSSAGTTTYSSVNVEGAGFSSQYNYSPSPGFSGQGSISHPPPQPGFPTQPSFSGQPGASPVLPPPPGISAQPGSASYLPPQPGFSGQQNGYQPPPAGYSEKPPIDPPPYDASIPSAPTM